jgi:magnesium transporter
MIRLHCHHAVGSRSWQPTLAELPGLIADENAFLWVDLDGEEPKDAERILVEVFKLHELMVEDALTVGHPAKIERQGDLLFILARAPTHVDDPEDTHKLALFMQRDLLVTVHRVALPAVDRMTAEVQKNPKSWLAGGVDLVASGLLDHFLESFEQAFAKLQARLDTLEEMVLDEQQEEESSILIEVLRSKRDLAHLQRTLSPLRDVLLVMSRDEFACIREKSRPYFRDLYDRMVRYRSDFEFQEHTLAGIRDAGLAISNNRLNRSMKTLTGITVILLPLTVITGIYGMNFKNMPEIDWRWGYVAVLLLMLLVAGSLTVLFRKRGFL